MPRRPPRTATRRTRDRSRRARAPRASSSSRRSRLRFDRLSRSKSASRNERPMPSARMSPSPCCRPRDRSRRCGRGSTVAARHAARATWGGRTTQRRIGSGSRSDRKPREPSRKPTRSRICRRFIEGWRGAALDAASLACAPAVRAARPRTSLSLPPTWDAEAETLRDKLRAGRLMCRATRPR